jgi:hypothetical protein
MKRLFFLFAILGCFNTCKKEPPPEPSLPDGFWGEASAEREGKLWKAYPSCWLDLIDKETIAIHLDSLHNKRYLTEILSFTHVPPIPGDYRVFPLDTTPAKLHSSLSFWDEDQPLGLYQILDADSTNNWIALESYDTLSREIKGKFSLTFIVEHRPYPYSPDTVRFRNGRFHGKIVDK